VTDIPHTNGSATHIGEGNADSKPATAVEIALNVVRDALPQCLAVGVMLGLIFGGCCSNVSTAVHIPFQLEFINNGF